VLQGEDFEGWTLLDDLKPGIYLGFLPLVGFLIWKRKFSFKELSKAGV
jgi:hypothetical protein